MKPKPAEPLKRFVHKFPPSLMKQVESHSGQFKRTRAIIEAIKEWLERKEALKQTINSK